MVLLAPQRLPSGAVVALREASCLFQQPVIAKLLNRLRCGVVVEVVVGAVSLSR